MWSTEESIETTASPDAIWRLWADVPTWPDWNAGIEHIALSGPFATGGTISMTPIGEEPVELRIEEAIEPELFVDVAELGDVVVRTIHRIECLDDDRNRMEITGPAADRMGPQLGPEISGDFPQTLAALVDRAQR